MLLPNDELKRKIFNEYLNNKISNITNGINGSIGGYLGDKLGEKAGLSPSVRPITNFAGSVAAQKAGEFAGQQLANHITSNVVGNLSSPLVSSAAGSLTGGAAGTTAATAAGAGAGGATGLLGASAAGGPIGLAIGAGIAGLSTLFNKMQEKKQNSEAARKLVQQSEQEMNSDLDEQRNRLNFSNPYVASSQDIQSDVQPNYAQMLEATLTQNQPQQQEQQPQIDLENLAANPWGSLNDEIINKVYGGTDYSKILSSPTEQSQEQGLMNKILSGIGDIKSGYKENVYGLPESNPNESGLYKLGEAFGTASRVAQNPILQGVVAGSAYGIDKGNALYGLSKGVEWASNKQNTNNYRDALANEGIYVNPGVFGSLSSSDYQNYARGPLRQAMTENYKAKAQNQEIENQNAQEMSGLTIGDYLKGAVLSGRFGTEQDMLNWANANNIDLGAKFNPEVQKLLLDQFKEKNKYGANKTANRKLDMIEAGLPTQRTAIDVKHSGGKNDNVTYHYPDGVPSFGGKGGNNNSNNVSQNGTIIVNPKTGERMKLVNGKWEKI